MNKKILDWLESLMEEEALGLAPNPYQEAMKKNIANQAAAQAVQETVQPTGPVDLGSQQMVNISDLFITGDAKTTAATALQMNGIDTLRHPDANGMHFGNPFSPNPNSRATVNVPTIKDSVEYFKRWLQGDPSLANVEPERRAWIVNQINNGSLKGKPLVYYTNKIPDNSYGTNMYNSKTAPNHAHVLLDMINNGITPYQSNEQLLSKLAKPKDLGEAQFKVISGGQTGIDILGVKLAKEYGLPTGGTIGMYPNGKYVIEADDAIDRSQFGFTTTDNTYYPYRTSQNVQNSDGTIYFKTDDDSRGYQATRREAMKYHKPFLENPASVDDAYKFITDNNIKTLNIAGNRGSKLPSELRLSTEELLRALFSKFKK